MERCVAGRQLLILLTPARLAKSVLVRGQRFKGQYCRLEYHGKVCGWQGFQPGEMESKSCAYVFSRLVEKLGAGKVKIFCTDRNPSVAKMMLKLSRMSSMLLTSGIWQKG
ncbi:Hypothetical predicted protein [Cloeon dipterum]|uniref:FLYWCH-type domain-containing protein n=1 Tax=Cloeon dipterum TaxID=197152 RepID=A0A8S1ECK2_9INSE|nr:Hypothetical predicted protein [Cloeon dipterum]